MTSQEINVRIAMKRADTAARILATIGLSIVVACGGDTTGPSTSGPGTADTAVTGSWVVSFGSLGAAQAFCTVPSLSLNLQKRGSSLEGDFSAHGPGSCLTSDGLFAGSMQSGSVSSGTLQNGTAHFDLGNSNFEFDGVVRGDSMAGTFFWIVQFAGSRLGVVHLTGNWKAARLPSNLVAGVPASIRLAPLLPPLLQGDSIQLVPTVRDRSGRVLSNSAVTFQSGDTTRVVVSSAGWVRSKGPEGAIKVAARAGSAFTEDVVVVLVRAFSIQVSPDVIVMNRYRELQLTAQALDFTGKPLTGLPITYTSSDSAAVSVTTTGYLRSRGPLGQFRITLTIGNLQATVPVTIGSFPVAVALTPSTAVLSPGGTQQLTAQVLDSVLLPIPGAPLVYHADNPSLVTISLSGLVTSIGPTGFTDVTATMGSLSSHSRILVRTGLPPRVVGTTPVSGQPAGLAVSSNGTIYVGDLSGRGLRRGDLPSFAISPSLALGGVIADVAFDPSGARAFIARDSSDGVAVVDVASNTVVWTLHTGIGAEATAVAVTPDGQKLFVGTAKGVLVYDASSYALLDSLPQLGVVSHLTPHPTLPLMYASNYHITEISTTSLSVTRQFGPQVFHEKYQGAAVSPDGAELLVVGDGGGLNIWDLISGMPREVITLASGYDVVVSRTTGLVYISEYLSNTVSIIDWASRVPVATLITAGTPFRIDQDVTGNTIVVSNVLGWVDFIR